jgi:hypothetical protein
MLVDLLLLLLLLRWVGTAAVLVETVAFFELLALLFFNSIALLIEQNIVLALLWFLVAVAHIETTTILIIIFIIFVFHYNEVVDSLRRKRWPLIIISILNTIINVSLTVFWALINNVTFRVKKTHNSFICYSFFPRFRVEISKFCQIEFIWIIVIIKLQHINKNTSSPLFPSHFITAS